MTCGDRAARTRPHVCRRPARIDQNKTKERKGLKASNLEWVMAWSAAATGWGSGTCAAACERRF